jgi:hypothetical protein
MKEETAKRPLPPEGERGPAGETQDRAVFHLSNLGWTTGEKSSHETTSFRRRAHACVPAS